ncbi:MAG: MotA/TolQ/ExbB proton channel family protein [Hyphomicrobiaceae bacterium]
MDQMAITPLGLFWQAGPIVKGVIVLLLAASVWGWVIILDIWISVLRLNRATAAAARGDTRRVRLLSAIGAAGETAATVRYPSDSYADVKTRIETAMRHKAAELLEGAEGGLPTLAVIASSAPFVGLFGTVWGIMTSFIGIAASKDTSLAVVAPGIAEALAATAIGLVAAIPAAIAYNRLGAALSRAGRRIGRLIDGEAARLASPAAPPSTIRQHAAE